MHATSTFIAENLADMPKNVEFLTMPYADCAKLLMSEAFVAADADRRCIAAIAWLNHGGVDSRALYIHDILNMIPLTPGSVSNDTILEASRCGMIWNYSPELVRDLLTGAVTFQSELPKPIASQGASSANVCSYRFSSNDTTWYVMGGEASPKLFLSYDTNRCLWTRLPALPKSMSDAGACAVGGRLVVMGGYAYLESDADIYEYDLAVKTWSDGPTGKLREGRSGLAACSDGRYVYAIGGDSDNYYSTNLVEQYDPESKVVRVSNLILPRYKPAAVFSSKHNCIFTVAGMSNSGQCYEGIEKFHVLRNTSSLAGQMTTGRCGVAAALSGDDLYIAGGYDNTRILKCVEIFNMRTGRVRKALDMVEYHRNCHAATIYDGNVICVLGGHYSHSVETYDVREGTWSNTGTIVPDMPESTTRFAFAAV